VSLPAPQRRPLWRAGRGSACTREERLQQVAAPDPWKHAMRLLQQRRCAWGLATCSHRVINLLPTTRALSASAGDGPLPKQYLPHQYVPVLGAHINRALRVRSACATAHCPNVSALQSTSTCRAVDGASQFLSS